MGRERLSVTAIPAFSDNYIWLLSDGASACAVVDPGDATPVIAHLEQHGLELDTILVTHHHPDHIGGIPALLTRWPARVVGPDDDRAGARDQTVREGDRVEIGALGLSFETLEVPGHTSTHVAYAGHGMLFAGDTLFSAGCGRLFEGTPAQMQASLDKLAALPGDTRVYCAHEYTRANCAFAREVEPNNGELREFGDWVDTRRRAGQPTLPSTIARERGINPFLRTREPAVVESANRLQPGTAPGSPTLAVIRQWKDRFQG